MGPQSMWGGGGMAGVVGPWPMGREVCVLWSGTTGGWAMGLTGHCSDLKQLVDGPWGSVGISLIWRGWRTGYGACWALL